jgi:hypothetical protein
MLEYLLCSLFRLSYGLDDSTGLVDVGFMGL